MVVEPGAFIRGPAIIDDHSTIRSGAYLRGNALIGKHVVLRCEVKNVVIMDKAEMFHPGYCGDSIIGYKGHFGNQVTTANLAMVNADTQKIRHEEVTYDTGCRKVGVILGDEAQLGCSVVTDPGTLLGPRTIVYPLTRLPKGIYGPDEIVKNKPLEKGIVERVRRRREK